MTDTKDLVVLNSLGDKTVTNLGLIVVVLSGSKEVLLKKRIGEPVSLQAVEETIDEVAENGPILGDDLRLVEELETTHENQTLIFIGLGTLEATSLTQNGLDRTQTPIVVDQIS